MDDPLRDVKERVLFEGQKAYIIANAAGAVALLIFFQTIWQQAGATSLKKGALCGIVAFAVGVGVALFGYVARYWALRKNQLDKGIFFQVAHVWLPILAILCFVAGLILPVVGGFDSLNNPQAPPAQAKEIPKDIPKELPKKR
jgi:uncharacterized membrane protein